MGGCTMQIVGPAQQDLCDEMDVLQRLLPFTGARVLELGCGAAAKTRQIAERTAVREIVAAEVDRQQHEKNLAGGELPKVTFAAFGVEAIAVADATFDIVLMFKSLHHVPLDAMDQGLAEIYRVLKPGGLAYISEPVFAGAFNEVIRLFHDESQVRQAAFAAVQRAVANNTFELQTEYFFKNVMRLDSFAQFEEGILRATFMDHRLSDDLLAEVRHRFESHATDDGYVFEIPNRVDLLRKPTA